MFNSKMSKEISNSITLSKEYGLDSALFHNVSIEGFDFSVRVNNCLNRHDPPIKTVEELLECSFDELKSIRSFGAKCVKEIDEAIQKIKSQDIITLVPFDCTKTMDGDKTTIQMIKGYKDDILNGHFDFLDHLTDEQEVMIAEEVKTAYYDLGPELIRGLLENKESMRLVLDFIEQEANKYDFTQFISSQIKSALEEYPNERLSNKIEGFVFAYTRDEDKIDQLLKWIQDNKLIEFNDIKSPKGVDENTYSLIIDFLRWCAFDLSLDIKAFQEGLYKNERDAFVVKSRAQGSSLNEIGVILGLTRERVRQIERKVRKRFTASISRRKIILKIYATRNQDDVLTPVELQDYFGEETRTILYLLRTSENASYVYDKDLDVLIVANDGLSERTASFMETLPENFNCQKLNEYIQLGVEEYDLDEEIIETAIQKEYTQTGNILHRSRLKLSSIYQIILKKYYPEGIWLYGDKELDEFREHVRTEFGDIQLAKNNRALTARIADVSVLCDRGTYKAKSEKYISDKLAADIFDYVERSETIVFLTNTLYALFEERLIAEGVTNKYFLQGILHELYGDKWIFRRDCISKDESATSVYAEVVRYIKSSLYPVDKKQIHRAFPGITDIVMAFAVSDPSIINLFGKYIHVCRMQITTAEKDFLKQKIDGRLKKNDVCNCRALYAQLEKEKPVMLSNNFVDSPFALYSFLEYEFGDQYTFSRPFIARQGTEIGTTADVLQEVITSSDEIDISDIRAFSQEHHLGIASMLDLINSSNDTHLLENEHKVICIELTGIDEHIVEEVEKIILEELSEKGTIPISQLQCITKFPSIELQWNEWLIYSAIKKWGKHLDVGTSSNQFRYAVPLIAKKGKMDESIYIGMSRDDFGQVVMPDDISDIDNLLMDFSEDEWGEQL